MAILGSTDMGDGLLTLTIDHNPTSTPTLAPAGSIFIFGNAHYRKLDDGETTNVALVLIKGEPHASQHFENASDEIFVELLGTSDTDTSKFLRPDGFGGLEFAVLVDELPHAGGNFIDTTDQPIAVVGTPQSITFDTNALIERISHTPGSDTFTIDISGIYKLMIAPQLGQGAGTAKVEFWLEINGVDVINSGVQQDLIANTEMLPLFRWKDRFVVGDTFRIIWASDNTNSSLDNITSSYGGPNIPSIMFGITLVGI